jgi:hypothetical protein
VGRRSDKAAGQSGGPWVRLEGMKLLSKTRDEESRPGNRSARKNRGEKKAW